MHTTVNWGVIGAGDVCERKSGPPLYETARSRLHGIYRRNQDAAADFVARHGHGRVYPSLEALLGDPDIDAIYVASPHALHAEHTVAALEAGKHVLVEKPMALSIADCERMNEAAAAANRALAVAYYRRGYPSVQRLRALLRDGAIGEPRTCAVNDEFPTSHRIDLMHYLFGSASKVAMERVTASQDGYRFEQMMPRIHLTLEGGVRVTMAGSWTETGMPESLHITGTSGTIHLTDLKGGLLTRSDASGASYHEECGGLPWTHAGTIANMVEHLLEGAPLLCDGHAGAASTAVLERLASSVSHETLTER
jgi:predicted dehydrogenase